MRIAWILSVFCLCLGLVSCRVRDSNEANLAITSALTSGTPTNLFFLSDIDNSLTPNCGIASPATATTPTTPGQPAQPAQTTTNTQGQNNTRFSVFSQLVFRTRENLGIRYIFDINQTQGPVDLQQGFTLTGGTFNNTVTGNRGTVRWNNQNGVNINPSVAGQQQISFFQIELDLSGTYTPGVTATTTPTSCNTIDGVNCTSAQSSTQCFTTDNRTCLVTNNAASGATAIIIRGRLNCNSPNVIQQ